MFCISGERVKAVVDVIYDYLAKNAFINPNTGLAVFTSPFATRISQFLNLLTGMVSLLDSLDFFEIEEKDRIAKHFYAAYEELKKLIRDLADKVQEEDADAAEALRALINMDLDELKRGANYMVIREFELQKRLKEEFGEK